MSPALKSTWSRRVGRVAPNVAPANKFAEQVAASSRWVISPESGTGEVAGEVTGEVTPEVGRRMSVLEGERSRRELQEALGLKHEDRCRAAYLVPALTAGLVEMTLPEKPQSSKQRHRLSASGQEWIRRRG